MLLLAAATDFEMKAYAEAGGNSENTLQLVTGLGPVETTLSLACMLHDRSGQIDAVLNFGVAGAYPDNGTEIQAEMLDICLAGREVLGDLGICLQDGFERFDPARLGVEQSFETDRSLLTAAGRALENSAIASKSGTFVTVNCASGTTKRGQLLGQEFQGLCENMEGAAAARVCKRFSVPFLEVRCISNMVEDRNLGNWKLKEACNEAGRAVAVIVDYLIKEDRL